MARCDERPTADRTVAVSSLRTKQPDIPHCGLSLAVGHDLRDLEPLNKEVRYDLRGFRLPTKWPDLEGAGWVRERASPSGQVCERDSWTASGATEPANKANRPNSRRSESGTELIQPHRERAQSANLLFRRHQSDPSL